MRMLRSLAACLPAALLFLLAAAPVPAGDRIAVVAVARANIRSGPGTGYPAIHPAEMGERLAVLEEFGAWVRIRLPREGQGWIFRELVNIEEAPAAPAPAVPPVPPPP